MTTPHENDQQIKNWLHALRWSDPADVRGIITGLAELLKLLALKTPAGPRPAPLDNEKGGES